MTAGDSAAALWIGPGTVLVRADLPEHLEDRKGAVEVALAAEGLQLHDDDTLFAAPIAIQALGLRVSSWDLWGVDLEESFMAIRAAAAGSVDSGFLEPGTPLDPGI